MRHIRVLICSVEPETPDEMTELASFELPEADITGLHPETAVDELETTTQETGTAILGGCCKPSGRRLTQRWRSNIANVFPPEHPIADGHASITVATRFGTIELSRQICYHADTQTHVMPGNAVLPPHHGMIITRGLQEWACLLPQELPFASVARLLGWQTHAAQVLAETTLRSLVRSHGQVIRQAEQMEVAALVEQDDLTRLDLQVVSHDQPRRRAGWPAEFNAAVKAALAAEQARPADGVSWADWQRVLTARQAEATCPVEELRQLGPKLEPGQVLLTMDEVLVRKPAPGHFLELRTARIVTVAGYRYVSGLGAAFLQHLLMLVLLALEALSSLLLIADGARWIRSFFTDTLGQVPQKTMLLDWQHLQQKCLDLSSRICRSKAAKTNCCDGSIAGYGAATSQQRSRCWRRTGVRPRTRQSWMS